MNQVTTVTTNHITMCSTEIAKLTGKEHRNVMADIRKMLTGLNLNAADFSAPQTYGNNNTREVFNLNRELSITLVSGYNVQMRHAIVTRWMELEAQTPKFDMSTELGRAAFMIQQMQEQQVAIAQVGHKLDTVAERTEEVAKSVEDLNAGNIPNGFNSYSNLSAIFRLSNDKCRKLVKELNLEHKKIPFVAPNGLITHMTVVDENSFKKAVARIKKEAVPAGRSMFNHKLLGNFKWI